MMLPLSFIPTAITDAKLARLWLDGVYAGLGEQMLDDLGRMAATISENPKRYDVTHRGCRRAVLHRFDYMLCYRVLADHIEVLGLLHCRLDPAIAARRSSAAS